MEITYKTDYQSNLFMYIEVESASDYKKINDKLHRHSEYDTEWDCKLAEWVEKKYYDNYHIEILQGTVKVMFILQFTDARANFKEFIPELYNYFNIDYSSFDKDFTYINYTKFISVKDI